MFPRYKVKKHSFFFLKWEEKTPDGWDDLGFVESTCKIVNGELRSVTKGCSLCCSDVKVGREDEKLFRFCPRCLTRTYKNSKK